MPSQTLYISPKELLTGHWGNVFAVEGFTLLCHALPIGLWFLLVNTASVQQSAVGCVILLWADLLLISPLKAGRVLFYSGIAKKESSVSFIRLFYFFKQGYRRTIRWRLRLWLVRYGYWVITLLPCSALLFWNRFLQNVPVLSAISLLLSFFLGIFAILFTEIRLFRYIAAVHLLPCRLSLKKIFEISRTVFGKQSNRLANFYIMFGWCFLFPPLFYTIRCLLVNEMMQEFAKQPLQHWKNRGKILSELYDILEEI